MDKKRKIIFIGGIAILVFLLLVFKGPKNVSIPEQSLPKIVVTENAAPVIKKEKQELPTKPVNNTISISVIAGDEAFHIAPVKGASLYDALVLSKENGQVEFSGKNYSGLGFFVTDIGSLHNGNGKYLFYYINNKEASVGVSAYILKDGDIIDWRLK